MRSFAGLCMLVSCVVWVCVARAQVPDHLKCYKVKDALKLSGTVDLNTPQFGADAGCTVSKAKLFCVPATKTNVAVTDKTTGTPITPLPVSGPQPGDHLCYKVQCPSIPPDQSVTDQFGNRSVTKFKAALVCTPAFKGSARFVDNGNGTVTDNYTGLQWETKGGAGGGADFANSHDVDNTYTWNTTFGGTDPNGTAFTDFLGKLNNCTSADGSTVSAAFAGHCDWRLPTIAELQTILLAPFPCGTSPCLAGVFGPTAASDYWSSTTFPTLPGYAWVVNFGNGTVVGRTLDNAFFVRAVRGPGS